MKAAKLGFLNFADHFLDHLKAGLIDWLTGSLPGIYIPKAFSLVEIAKFAFSVLGLTWANIRQKLVKATSETVVKAMETGFDIVVTLVRDGPAAAWDKIKEQLSNLKDMVIGGITDFVVDMVVKKAIPKLIAMFIPGAGLHLGDPLDLRHHHGVREQDQADHPGRHRLHRLDRRDRRGPDRRGRERGSRARSPACCRSPSTSSPASRASARSPTRSWG